MRDAGQAMYRALLQAGAHSYTRTACLPPSPTSSVVASSHAAAAAIVPEPLQKSRTRPSHIGAARAARLGQLWTAAEAWGGAQPSIAACPSAPRQAERPALGRGTATPSLCIGQSLQPLVPSKITAAVWEDDEVVFRMVERRAAPYDESEDMHVGIYTRRQLPSYLFHQADTHEKMLRNLDPCGSKTGSVFSGLSLLADILVDDGEESLQRADAPESARPASPPKPLPPPSSESEKEEEEADNSLLSWSAVVTPAGLTTLSPRIVFDCFILTRASGSYLPHINILKELCRSRTTWFWPC
ncbi:hypothetical protein EMIHUDRAFT_205122 [Emiliania huxleyi CCMP1516]|uniref:Uncharacterized protein n=2 Tax=Emiliania huxleyi TaxID=2903 RepID=A0A0D3JUI1_EMIH1|nr:hypothetical protein EMIHUDRAFT_205122 [Emiliania huxleyi CCMP1516]EOD27166.1 hypothetical protein EMIHUDRAFT_205122 [Emiliania huxleyi CCMP1516]|eukprot:XP_005779595.1 hypothetical protein EMIHUDRAFT_205122 [Emiliania huxleyi CCMP1516]